MAKLKKEKLYEAKQMTIPDGSTDEKLRNKFNKLEEYLKEKASSRLIETRPKSLTMGKPPIPKI